MITVQTLIRRCLYGGRKGKRAWKRLMAMSVIGIVRDGSTSIRIRWDDGHVDTLGYHRELKAGERWARLGTLEPRTIPGVNAGCQLDIKAKWRAA